MNNIDDSQNPREHWNEVYGDTAKWSGNPNPGLVRALEFVDLDSGRAVELGCGEGADVMYLASQGIDVTGVDVSTTAISRARELTENAADQLSGEADFIAADLEEYSRDIAESNPELDLVTACFFHSRIGLDRQNILRRFTAALKQGGYLVVLSHAAPPPWSEHHHDHDMPTLDEEIATAGVEEWNVLLAEEFSRDVTTPEPATLTDLVIVAQKP